MSSGSALGYSRFTSPFELRKSSELSTMDVAPHRAVVPPMAWRMPCRSPRPFARAMTMEPPTASAVNTSTTSELTEPTMLVAAMAASPVEETIAVERMLMKTMKNWSITSVRNMLRSSP